MYGYIYKTTNLINGKIYVGQHKVDDDKLDGKYYGSGLYLIRAIEKYGKENFSCEILEWCENKEALNSSEKEWIKELNSQDKNIGYNIDEGGQGGFSIDTSGENNPMYDVHRYGELNPNYGNKWQESSRSQMSQTIANKGGHHGELNPMYGKKHTQDSKEKMKKAKLDENGEYKYRKEKSVNYGKHETHPCFGLYWWSDGINPPVKSKVQPTPNHHRGRK